VSIVIEAITFDCADPQRLAEFWAGVTGFQVQLALGSAGRKAGIESDIHEFPRLLFVRVPEGKTVKNRIHLDLQADDMDAEVARLVELGASVVEERNLQDHAWTVLRDPEGKEFRQASVLDRDRIAQVPPGYKWGPVRRTWRHTRPPHDSLGILAWCNNSGLLLYRGRGPKSATP
jgi:hypothetical protein